MDNEKIIVPGKWHTEYDKNGNLTKTVYSDSYLKLFGKIEKKCSDPYESWASSIHPDDFPRVAEYYKQALEKNHANTDYDIEYRKMTEWGYRWFHDYGHYTRYEDGSLKGCDGIIFDINDAKTMNPILGGLPISHDLLKQSNIGLWAFELDEGCPPRMYGDEAMMKLLGIEGPATPEQVYHAWYDHIDKDHYDEVHASVDKMGNGIHSEVQYPWHYEDGRTIIVRCGGIKNPKYTKGLRIEGVHRDVTNLTHYEKEKELQDQILESQKVIESFTNSYNVAYKVNLATDTFTVLRMDASMIGYGKEFKTFTKALEFFTNEVVYEPDRNKMCAEVDYQTIRQKLQNVSSYEVEYRVLINNASIWHKMIVKSLDDNQIAIGFTPQNEEILLEKIQEKMNKDYYALFSIDLDTELMTVLKNAPWYTVVKEGQSIELSKILKFFLKDVSGDAKAFFEQFKDISQTRKIFTKEEKRSFTYLSVILKRWINASIYVLSRHEDSTPATISLGFSFVDSFESEKQKLQDLLRENMEIVGGFTSEYLALYYINLNDKTFKVYSVNGDRIADTMELLNKSTDPVTLIHMFGESPAVHPDDRHLFKDLSTEKARELLRGQKKYSMRFRRDYGEGYKWSVMDVVKNEKENEEANTITIGFAECDNDIRREQALVSSLAILSSETQPDKAINEQLSLLGDFFGAERAYIFEYSANKETIQNTYEWCAKNVEPMKDKLQNVPVEYIDVWVKEFEKNGAFYMSSLKDAPQTSKEGAEVLAMQGITSLLAAPLMQGNEIKGFIGVDNPTKAKKNLEVLKTAACISFSEILRRKEDDEEHITLSKLTDAFLSVYYTDLSTDYMRTWKIDDFYKKEYGSTKSYSESMGGYVKNNIAVNERERCIKMTSPEYVLEQFKKTDRFSIEMTDIMTGHERNIVFDYIKVNKDGTQLVICCRDISDSVAKQKAQQEKLKEALDEAQEANIKISEQGAFTKYFLETYISAYYVNLDTQECQIYKRTSKLEQNYPIINSYIESLDTYIAKDVLPEFREKITKITRPEKMRELLAKQNEFFYVYKHISNGEERTCRLQVIRGADDNHAAFGFKDITEEVRVQEEQQKNLENALSMAQSANRAKTTFLNNMSHDIRTPMNAIIGYTGLAANHIDNKEQVQDYLDKISQSSNHLLSLINDVLDMSRIESGKMSIEDKDENILEIIDTLKSIVQADINAKQLDFHVDFIDLDDDDVICDKLRLNQVLLNILSNAIKYTATGGAISMHITEIAKKKDFGTFEFRIKDNGMGMSKEFLETIYDPFTRVKSSTVSGIQGTGLGMAITKNIVDMMGGNIEIQSELGKGTEVIITFNFKVQNDRKKTESENVKFNFKGKKVLLVEDNEFNREIATELLEEYGFDVLTANDGDIAVETIRNAKTGDFNLILMDIQMPTIDGYEATRQIRALKTKISQIPIIAMTANAFEEDRKKAFDAGMDDHITKPINLDALKESLARILSKRK